MTEEINTKMHRITEREDSMTGCLISWKYPLISSFIRDIEHFYLLLKIFVEFLAHFRNGITGNENRSATKKKMYAPSPEENPRRMTLSTYSLLLLLIIIVNKFNKNLLQIFECCLSSSQKGKMGGKTPSYF